MKGLHRRALTSIAVAFGILLWGNAAHADKNGATAMQGGATSTEHPPDDSAAPRRLRVGVIGGIGFPRPLGIEGMAVLGGRVALGAEYGALPTMAINGVNIGLWSLAGDVRVFPFRGQFFVGLRAGHQHVDASTTITVRSVGSASEALALDSWFMNPRVGVLWTSREGLTFGVEAGVQIPLGATVSSTLPLSLDPSAEKTADAIGGSVIPTVDLLRVGLLL